MRTLLLVLATMTLGGCAASHPAAPAGTTAVELDAFSGVPNPVWTLSVNEERELDERLGAATPGGLRDRPDGRLGYRGFYVHATGLERPFSREVYVAGGFIWIERAGTPTQVLADAGDAEEWLVALARREGYRDVFAARDRGER